MLVDGINIKDDKVPQRHLSAPAALSHASHIFLLPQPWLVISCAVACPLQLCDDACARLQERRIGEGGSRRWQDNRVRARA